MVATEPPPSADTRAVAPARRIRGEVRVPGDKSVSHRAALFNAVADGQATIRGFSPGADGASTLACLEGLGVDIVRSGAEVLIRGVGAHGLCEPGSVLDCGNSGTTMRLLSGLLAGQDLFAVLTGDASLRRRPMARVAEPLRAMGARIEGRDQGRLPPLAILPANGLRGTRHELKVASAQVKSALLLAGLYADGPTTVVEPATTRDHTERLLRAMGARVDTSGSKVTIQPTDGLRAVDVDVPGDFSSAAYWLVLACLHPDAEVAVRDVGVNPSRTGLLTILERMGADVRLENVRDVAGEPVADLVARSSRLRATQVDGRLVALAIDEIPLVALLGLFADGETVVRDAHELRVKESDRVTAVAEGLRALGGDVDATEDGWRVRPSRLRRGRVRSYGDHRMAMLFALAGVLGDGAELEEAGAIDVSYPSFWQHLHHLVAA